MIVEQYPELQRLAELGSQGWRFLHRRAEPRGDVVEIIAIWTWVSGPVDLVRFRDRDDALGVRMTDDDPPRLCFERTGTLAEVIQIMSELPPPTDPRAPRPSSLSAPLLTMRGRLF